MAERPPALAEVVALVSAKANRFRQNGLNEQNTKASLIEPVLEVLGWEIRDPDEVHREFRPKGRDKPVDYALKLLRKPRLFLEAKGLGESLADRKWIGQVLGYAVVAGVEWCVLTDGNEYRFYNAIAAVDADDKMFYRIKLTETPQDECVRALTLMSRANLEENLLDIIWTSHFVDRRVKSALTDLIGNASPSLIRILRQQVSKLTPKEIADSLRRLDIRIESPAIVTEAIRAKAAPPPTKTTTPASKPGAKKPGTKRSPVTIAGSLADIVAAGHLKTPLPLFTTYMDKEVRATLHPSGKIEFGGKTFDNCSSAGAAAKASVSGKPKATNGWEFWRYKDGAGTERDLAYARSLLAKK